MSGVSDLVANLDVANQGEHSLSGSVNETSHSSFSRQATRRLRPMLTAVKSSKWSMDADLELGNTKGEGRSRWSVLVLAFQTLGIVYGDIGTSPLYVFAGIFQADVPTTVANIEGAASLIIWTIAAIVMVKYAVIVLRADDNGQGGSFALYAQLRRQGTAAVGSDSKADSGTHDSRDWRQKFIESRFTQRCLLVAVVLGVGLIMGDGVLTPAISVVSAIEGLQTGFPSLSRGAIVGISVAIIIVLFSIQQFGTSKIGFTFAPIMCTFFAINSGVGIYNIAKYQPGIFKVLGPNYWFSFFLRNGTGGWRSLAGVLLCITGAEALFADLGHFNRGSIQIGAFFVVFPSLILTYLGQAAYLTAFPGMVSTTFYSSIPSKGLFWVVLVVATLAAVVASQALISAVFQIVKQAITLSFFPRFKVTHTSATHAGQIYIAVINYVIMILTVVVVVAFRTSARLGLAYGLAVNMDLLLTTCFTTLVMITVWRTNVLIPAAFFLVFATIEATFLSSSLLKVPSGGWFSLMLAAVYGYLMLLWFWGSNRKRAYFSGTRKVLGSFLKVKRGVSSTGEIEDAFMLLRKPTDALHRVPGYDFYYGDDVRGIPHAFVKLVDSKPTLPHVSVFITIRYVPLPEVLPMERYLVQQLGAPGFYHVIARYGYNQRVKQNEETVSVILQHILALLYRNFCMKVYVDDRLNVELMKCPLSPASMAVVDAALGEMHGKQTEGGHTDITAMSANSLSMSGLSHSVFGTGTQMSRTAPVVANASRPSIMGVAWPEEEAAAAAERSTSGRMGSRGTTALPAGSPLGSAVDSIQRGVSFKPASYEQELQGFGEQMGKSLLKYRGASGQPEQLDLLRSLAAEISLVAVAAQQGCNSHVVGRAHLKLLPDRNPFRQYGLVAPFDFLSRTVEVDIATAFSIDEEKLLEIGLNFHL